MRLYTTPNGSWAGTQADARALAKLAGGTWAEVNVPVDKEGLLAFLNSNRVGAEVSSPACPVTPATHAASPSMDAASVLSRIDNPGTDVDAIVSTIASAKGHALKRYATAVAYAFEGLFNGH